MSTPLVDEGRLLLALADPSLCEWDRRVLRALYAQPAAALTLDELADAVSLCPDNRPHIFAAVARLENRGWLPQGAVR